MPTSNEDFKSNAPFVTTLFLNTYKEDEEDEEDEQQTMYREKVTKIQSSIEDTIINVQRPPEMIQAFADPPSTPLQAEKKPEATLKNVVEEEPLPQSMADIYKMSNIIKRKRNKEKKKLKQEEEEEEEEEEEDKSLKNKKLKGEGKVTDPVEFMKEIGWVDKQQQQHQQSQQSQNFKNSTQSRNSNYQRKGNFTPYDYSNQQQQQTPASTNNQSTG
jgi:hypothetical protein